MAAERNAVRKNAKRKPTENPAAKRAVTKKVKADMIVLAYETSPNIKGDFLCRLKNILQLF